jgi:diacylglycerol kinase (ATP)
VLVAGGDGLVHLAIQELAGSSVPVAIAPVGTGNDFASALGLSTIDSTVVVSEPVAIDLIRIVSAETTKWVASIAIAGFPASINDRANRMSLPFGSQVYTIAAALELPGFRRTLLSIEIDGETIETDTAMLAIGNTKLFGGGMLACPDARPNDGLLHLTSIQGVGRMGILRHLAGRRGGTANRPEVLRRTGRQIRLQTSPIAVWGDGEPVGVGPLDLTIDPGALLVAGADPT